MVKVHKSLGNSAFSLTNPIKTSIYIVVGNLGRSSNYINNENPEEEF